MKRSAILSLAIFCVFSVFVSACAPTHCNNIGLKGQNIRMVPEPMFRTKKFCPPYSFWSFPKNCFVEAYPIASFEEVGGHYHEILKGFEINYRDESESILIVFPFNSAEMVGVINKNSEKMTFLCRIFDNNDTDLNCTIKKFIFSLPNRAFYTAPAE